MDKYIGVIKGVPFQSITDCGGCFNNQQKNPNRKAQDMSAKSPVMGFKTYVVMRT
jgi:hypothetical protein